MAPQLPQRSIVVPARPENAGYLSTKRDKRGHLLGGD